MTYDKGYSLQFMMGVALYDRVEGLGLMIGLTIGLRVRVVDRVNDRVEDLGLMKGCMIGSRVWVDDRVDDRVEGLVDDRVYGRVEGVGSTCCIMIICCGIIPILKPIH